MMLTMFWYGLAARVLFLLLSSGSIGKVLCQKCDGTNQISRPGELGLICYELTGTITNWNTARNNCQALEGELAVIGDQHTQDFLNTLSSANVLGYNKNIWIGGYLLILPNWEWIDGTILASENGSFPTWTSGYPVNAPGAYYVSMVTAANYFWQNSIALLANGYICQYASTSCGALGADYEELLYDGVCFRIYTSGNDWFGANSSCTTLDDGMLATVNDDSTFTALQTKLTLMASPLNGYWIGLQRADWTWVDGTPVFFTNWGLNQPNPTGTGISIKGSCGNLCPSYLWEAQTSSTGNPALCQTFYNITTSDSVTTSNTQVTSEITSGVQHTTNRGLETTPTIDISVPVSTVGPEKSKLGLMIGLIVFGVLVVVIIIIVCGIRKW